jgi:hypothetical protein
MKKIICILIPSLLLVSHSCVESSDKIEEAKARFENYVNALKGADQEKAKEYWNKQEKERYEIYDWRLKDIGFKKIDLQGLAYRITKTQEKEEYVVMQLDWYYPEDNSNAVQKDTRYFIREDGRMVGANPIFVLTRDWLTSESRHFIYHYKTTEDEPNQGLLDKIDDFYETTVDFLEVDYQDRIDYYRCDSADEVGSLFGLEGSLARSDMINGVVAAMQDFVPHEIVHVISYSILPEDEKKLPPDYLNEGLAYLLGGATFFAPDLMLSWAKRRIAEDEKVSLNTLIHDPFGYDSNDAAGLMSSLVKFLIETFGLSEFKRLYGLGRAPREQRQNLEKVYQKRIGELDSEWKNHVLSLSLPEVKAGTSLEGLVLRARPEGGEIIHVSDPAGDDKGDGSYVYPQNEKAVPGMFDLIDFRMSKHDEFVYFELEFSDLTDAQIKSDEGFNGTFAAVIVDTDNVEKSGNTRLFYDNGNFVLSEKDAYEFVIEVSNAGVLVHDQDWVWQLLFLKALSEESHIQDNKFVFAIPQTIIGSPDSSWKIQVVTGGQWGGYKNTAYGVGSFMRAEKRAKKDQEGDGKEDAFNPDIYDILAAEGLDQMKILGNYSQDEKKKAVIPLVSLKSVPTGQGIEELNNPLGVD